MRNGVEHKLCKKCGTLTKIRHFLIFQKHVKQPGESKTKLLQDIREIAEDKDGRRKKRIYLYLETP